MGWINGWGAGCVAFVLMNAACGAAEVAAVPPPPPPPPPPVAEEAPGCTKDVDCKGDRVCESGRCVEQHLRAAPPAPPPPPQTLQAGGVRPIRVGAATFLIPAFWEDCQLPTVQACARSLTPLDGFRTNVNLVTQPYGGDTDTFARANAAALAGHATIETTDVLTTVGGQRGVVWVALWPGSSEGQVAYRTLQFLVADGRQGYVVTCAAAASAFGRERSRCETILRSFDLAH